MINVPYIRAYLMHKQADPMPTVCTIEHAYKNLDLMDNQLFIPIRKVNGSIPPFILFPVRIYNRGENGWFNVQRADHAIYRTPISDGCYHVEPTRPVIAYPKSVSKETIHAVLNR